MRSIICRLDRSVSTIAVTHRRGNAEKRTILAALVEEPGTLDLISKQIIGSAFKVASTLGNGFVEKVYENSVAHELRKLGFVVEQQKGVPVFCEDVRVGKYKPDTIVDDSVIVEIKIVRTDVHKAQCPSYLKATGFRGLPSAELRKPEDIGEARFALIGSGPKLRE